MYLIFSNILSLTNYLEIGDQNMTLENYEQMLEHLNITRPNEVADVKLRSCVLQNFLDQVLRERSIDR
jgi:hypothetical protein